MAANLRKRRGTARGSITRLSGCVTELEATPDQPRRTSDRAQQLLTKLQTLESDYRTLHLQIVDLIAEEDTESLDAEQTLIDTLDDDVSDLTLRLEALFAPTRADSPAAPALDRRSLNRRLARIRAGLDRIDAAIISVTADIDKPEEPGGDVDHTQLSQYYDELSDYKKDLATLYDELASEDIPDDDALFTTHSALERQLSTSSHKIKTLLVVPHTDTRTPRPTTGTGVKLPKLDVPVFDGNIIHWKQFWDQFTVAVHSKTNLSNAEKTVYLQHAIKDGSAKNAIEGLSHSGVNYEKPSTASNPATTDHVSFNVVTFS